MDSRDKTFKYQIGDEGRISKTELVNLTHTGTSTEQIQGAHKHQPIEKSIGSSKNMESRLADDSNHAMLTTSIH